MTRKLLSVDEFRAGAKDGARPDGIVARLAVAEPEVGADDTRKVRFTFSDATVDHSGDSISVDGWQLDVFAQNPVALWCHDSYSPPLGSASNVGPAGGKLMGDIEFATADLFPFADMIYRMVKAKLVRAVSVGFLPVEWKFVSDSKRPFGIDFVKQKLLEISLCPIPCNPNALQSAKSLGIDTAPLREWASKVLDEGGTVLIPRGLLEDTFRQAKTPRAVRQKYLAKSETPDWKVGAAADLPIMIGINPETGAAAAWDAAAAAKRILDDAGFDGENPDVAKAARGFLLHDAANPVLRSSYKLPFADIIDGAIKAIKGGVIAAKGRLDQTEVPPAVLDEASDIVDGYEKNFDEAAVAPQDKSGRRISTANEAKLREALDHHESASKCIKDVLASNATDDGSDDDGDGDKSAQTPTPEPEAQPQPEPELDPRAKRLAEAKALRAQVQI